MQLFVKNIFSALTIKLIINISHILDQPQSEECNLHNKLSTTIVTLSINDGGHVEVQLYILYPTIKTIKALNIAYKFSCSEK
jgi:hypothetical protein